MDADGLQRLFVFRYKEPELLLVDSLGPALWIKYPLPTHTHTHTKEKALLNMKPLPHSQRPQQPLVSVYARTVVPCRLYLVLV